MVAREPKRSAIVRAFDLVLTFESDKSDEELEREIYRILDVINDVLQTEVIKELPQIEFDNQNGKKKIKIGVLPLNAKAEE